jgi:hypothetical protein
MVAGKVEGEGVEGSFNFCVHKNVMRKVPFVSCNNGHFTNNVFMHTKIKTAFYSLSFYLHYWGRHALNASLCNRSVASV